MELLTIGAFAGLTRLSPKALRLYAELGLLPPAHVDPLTGYRYYAPAQQEQARLVAWLRRLDLPLARIRQICELGPAEAAEQVRRFWAEVEADLMARRDLAGFVIGELTGRPDPDRSDKNPARSDKNPDRSDKSPARLDQNRTALRYAARSHVGLVRNINQDAVFASDRLIAVADGFGAGGPALRRTRPC
jgi:DNA-binding transcriptional MerR regulator